MLFWLSNEGFSAKSLREVSGRLSQQKNRTLLLPGGKLFPSASSFLFSPAKISSPSLLILQLQANSAVFLSFLAKIFATMRPSALQPLSPMTDDRPNEQTLNLISNKRKSRLRDLHEKVSPPSLPKIRMIEFQHHGAVRTLPASYQFSVHFHSTSSAQRSEGGNILETPGPKNGKVKVARNRSTKKTKASLSCQTPAVETNHKLPQPSFRVLTDVEEYKEPAYSSAAYYRKNANIYGSPKKVEPDGAPPKRRMKKGRGRKRRHEVKTSESKEEEDHACVEYDMDEEDSIWLDIMNKKRRADRLHPVDRNEFEKMMDKLENESYKHNQHKLSGSNVDADADCSICNDGECQNSNAILFCDMCNLAVHQECYGVPYIPEGQWLCRRCLQSPNRPVDCVLCPNKGGAFKHTDDNRWAHVICALWIPEVCFANTVFLEPIDSIGAIPPARWKLICCVCQKKNVGACIQCHKSNCYVAFHVTCAQKAGLYMKIEAVIEKGPQGVTNTTVRKLAYCNNHGPKVEKKSDDEKSKEKVKEEKVRKNEPSQSSMDDKISIPVDVLCQISCNLNFPRRNQFLLRLYSYWRLKRLSRNGAPLIRRLQNSIRLDQLVEKKKETGGKRERNKLEKYVQKLRTIRYSLENGRLLMNEIIKRERLKFLIHSNHKQCQLFKMTPFNQFLNYILDQVTKKDVDMFFTEPVDTTAVNDYLKFITEPMDLGTMKTKVQLCKYTSIDAFKYDLKLIVDNCKSYNESDTVWHKAAIKLEEFIDEQFVQLEPFLEAFNQQAGTHLLPLPPIETPSSQP